MDFRGKKVLITGGTGFIGSNLVFALGEQGADLTVLAETETHTDRLKGLTFKFEVGDIRNPDFMNRVVQGQEYIFNLAAKVSHMDKGVVSYEDLDVNCRGQLTFLEACRLHNKDAKIVFTSSRMVYSDDAPSPFVETAPTDPLTLYGIHKLTAEKYHLSYFVRHGIRSTVLRISNPYGDRQHLSNGLYSMPGYFMNRAIHGETTEILSDGKQVRDYIYIGDLVDALLKVALSDKTNGQIYNCGSGRAETFGDMVATIDKTVHKGKFVYAKNPVNANSKHKDSYYLNVDKLKKAIDWQPATDLKTGVQRMYEFALSHPA